MSIAQKNGEKPEDHDFQIFVNSRPRKIAGTQISFIQVLELAGFDTTGQNLGLYDVDWVHGHKAGTLTPGHSVALENGMKFDAGKSNRS